MIINTCSGSINFAKELENESAKFYKDLSQKFEQYRDLFLTFAKENEEYIVNIERAYYGVITDAIEGCFAFNIDSKDYMIKGELSEGITREEALLKALDIEEKIIKFYKDASEQSKSLMADVPRAFRLVAKKREKRLSTLKIIMKCNSEYSI